MDRRCFLKAVTIGVPLLYINPRHLFDLIYNSIEPDDSNCPVIIGIGNYGKRVINMFNYARHINPVINLCDHIPINTNIIRTIEVSPIIKDMSKLIIKEKYAIIIFDPMEYGALSFSNSLAKAMGYENKTECWGIIKHCNQNLLIDSPYSLLLNVQSEKAYELLHTLYSVILGCSTLGNLVCFQNYMFNEFIEKSNIGYVITYIGDYSKRIPNIAIINGYYSMVSNLCNKKYHMLYLIFEIAFKKVSVDIFDATFEAIEYIKSLYKSSNYICKNISYLPHPNRTTSDMKLTIVGSGYNNNF